MRKYIIGLIATIALCAGLASSSDTNAATRCDTNWGSLAKTTLGSTWGPLTNIRTGQNTCYDRMIFDMASSNVGYTVRYVSNVYAEGSGILIPLNGGAKLQVTVNAPSYDINTGVPTYPGVVGSTLPSVNVANYKTFRDAKYAGSFEGYTTVGLGVRARLPFRVLQLSNRVVVDVAHNW
jgi:hypothetical protein